MERWLTFFEPAIVSDIRMGVQRTEATNWYLQGAARGQHLGDSAPDGWLWYELCDTPCRPGYTA